MKNIFALPATFAIPLTIIAIGLIWALFSIIPKNLNSKDVVFSFSAMAAALAMFYLSTSLSVRGEIKYYVIQTRAVLTKDLVMDVTGESEVRKSSYIVLLRENLSRAVRPELQRFDEMSKAGNGFDDEGVKKLEDTADHFYMNSV